MATKAPLRHFYCSALAARRRKNHAPNIFMHIRAQIPLRGPALDFQGLKNKHLHLHLRQQTARCPSDPKYPQTHLPGPRREDISTSECAIPAPRSSSINIFKTRKMLTRNNTLDFFISTALHSTINLHFIVFIHVQGWSHKSLSSPL